MSRIATVFGATGLQGGSVVRQLLKDGTFKPRAVTRNPNSGVSKELVKLGADVVEGDLSSYDSIKKAIAGAEVVFAVTFPVHGEGRSELEEGKFIVEAAKDVGVKYLVWSSVPAISGTSGGKYRASFLDDKAEVDTYLRASGLPHSIVYTGWFLENWTRKEYPDCASLNEKGEITFKARWVPGTEAPLTWIERDLGPSISALFNAYSAGRLAEINGKDFAVLSAKLPIENWNKVMETVSGRKVKVEWLQGFYAIPGLGEAYDAVKEVPFYSDRQVPDPGLTALGVKFGTLEEFVRTELKAHLGL
ncbi:NmrA-domain-containing protein [Exidia glandulosa HHB12029]|uniref:NmrA-domain-containing protein n=1 Tax=Exidia glandulosa HHB12029 TaxID=1314781 RepID=A0A165LR38_EXIGL|nr:NmrA-domain-containing protein [Exidia glandulosa HHB12029]